MTLTVVSVVPPKPRPDEGMVSLAKAIHRAVRARNATITPEMSRILRADPDYEPRPRRSRSKDRPPRQAKEPSVFTIQRIARYLGVTVGDLLGEEPYDLREEDRATLQELANWLLRRFDVRANDDIPPERRSRPAKPDAAFEQARATLERLQPYQQQQLIEWAQSLDLQREATVPMDTPLDAPSRRRRP